MALNPILAATLDFETELSKKGLVGFCPAAVAAFIVIKVDSGV